MKDRFRMPVSRRVFVRAAASIGVSAVAAGSFAAWTRYDAVSWENLRARLAGYRHVFSRLDETIRRHYSYLDIDPEGLRQFVTAYEAAYGRKTWRQSTKDAFERFLLSSDFFQNGADESRPVRFVMLYDPRRSPCYNPLARL